MTSGSAVVAICSPRTSFPLNRPNFIPQHALMDVVVSTAAYSRAHFQDCGEDELRGCGLEAGVFS
ncbi:protein of unknown function [Candidatus Filomicrobium marinum]|uniref:Uncharacterized protein n=1 Tax=Candidatus Filomicrobium marinum TaxID=1608628 RepID=A0A0D6JIP9_9HYPH|nr:protein of unknown function [Candidatus Filomicrobium marinum]CPR21337.1 protein of unknown function [Candidatus Filomicrobium marinum]